MPARRTGLHIVRRAKEGTPCREAPRAARIFLAPPVLANILKNILYRLPVPRLGPAPAPACSFDYATISVPQSLFPYRAGGRAAAQVLATYCRARVQVVYRKCLLLQLYCYRLPSEHIGECSTSPKLAPRRARRRGAGTTIAVRRS